jgi:hypothetical protein
VREPHVPEEFIVSFLVENELTVTAETGVDFAVFVEIGCIVPRAVVVVEVEDGAFADVDE